MKKGLFIYQKIIIIQFISILFIMIVFGIYFYILNLNKEIKQLTIQSDQLKGRLSSNLAIPLWNFDMNSCEKLLTEEINDKYMLGIIVKQNNKLFLGKVKSEKGEIVNIDDIAKYQDYLNKSYKIEKVSILYKDNTTDKEVGELLLYITDNYIKAAISGLLKQTILQALILGIILSIIIFIILNIFLDKPLKQITRTATHIAKGDVEIQAEVSGQREIATLAMAFNSMTDQLRNKAEGFRKTSEILTEIIEKAKEIILNLDSSSKEIGSAAQEQSSGANEQASGITEVSATLEELTITAKQITKNVGELVLSSEEVQKLLDESENHLLNTVSQLEEIGKISIRNASEIGELGKRSVLINEMVKMIKEIANKTNMLSINASIEAAKNKETGAGFSVIATEIRELSQETIGSAKNVERAAKEIQDFLNSIIKSSETESQKIIKSAQVAKVIYDNMETIVGKIKNNYTFTQKIDVSIKQQENGSRQAADTMKQMAEISRQSAETARQTSLAVNNIVNFSGELDNLVNSFNSEENIDHKEDKKIIKNKLEENNNKEKVAVGRKIIDRFLPDIDPVYKQQKVTFNLQKNLQSLAHILKVLILEQLPAQLSKAWDFILKSFNSLSLKLIKIKNTKLYNKKI